MNKETHRPQHNKPHTPARVCSTLMERGDKTPGSCAAPIWAVGESQAISHGLTPAKTGYLVDSSQQRAYATALLERGRPDPLSAHQAIAIPQTV
ncbi:hypothetical protein [Comamonas sp. lk]|uniref:hypothetical protein n=1 Tax=Comamonas sp. lk TaxID=2201272 RepID=UPI0013CF3F3D|nr:hypothetical protein [Comamonas sp. lk]